MGKSHGALKFREKLIEDCVQSRLKTGRSICLWHEFVAASTQPFFCSMVCFSMCIIHLRLSCVESLNTPNVPKSKYRCISLIYYKVGVCVIFLYLSNNCGNVVCVHVRKCCSPLNFWNSIDFAVRILPQFYEWWSTICIFFIFLNIKMIQWKN